MHVNKYHLEYIAFITEAFLSSQHSSERLWPPVEDSVRAMRPCTISPPHAKAGAANHCLSRCSFFVNANTPGVLFFAIEISCYYPFIIFGHAHFSQGAHSQPLPVYCWYILCMVLMQLSDSSKENGKERSTLHGRSQSKASRLGKIPNWSRQGGVQWKYL